MLRARLDLDSGYLSRVLRSLERAGLVEVVPSERDGRVRRARLTRKGAPSGPCSSGEATSSRVRCWMPLDEPRRERLVAAMGEVERLLTASPSRSTAWIRPTRVPGAASRPTSTSSTGASMAGFDPAASISAGDDELRLPAGLMLVASLRAEPVGCGALKLHGEGPAELKRMWVAPAVRGLGVGRRLLEALESEAVARGATVVRLETNRSLTEAIAMYRAAGYAEVPAFNDERYAHHWFEKRVRRP